MSRKAQRLGWRQPWARRMEIRRWVRERHSRSQVPLSAAFVDDHRYPIACWIALRPNAFLKPANSGNDRFHLGSPTLTKHTRRMFSAADSTGAGPGRSSNS